METKSIIYIIGAGRSGTTLLDIIIGNEESIESCGELNRYPRRRGIPPKYEKGSRKYLFWEKIYQHNNFSVKKLLEIEKINDEFEYHKGFLKGMLKLQNKDNLKKYKEFQIKLFNSIFESIPNNVTTIVDSSKYPGRAVMLSSFLPYEISYIYIKRDPVSVVKSFAKKDVEQPSKSWFASNLYYSVVNTFCHIAICKLRKKHKVVVVTYEEMVNKPIEMLRKVELGLDIELKSVLDKIKNNIPLDTGMLFDGNRIRLNKNLSIQSSKKIKLKSIKDFIVRCIHIFLYKP